MTYCDYCDYSTTQYSMEQAPAALLMGSIREAIQAKGEAT